MGRASSVQAENSVMFLSLGVPGTNTCVFMHTHTHHLPRGSQGKELLFQGKCDLVDVGGYGERRMKLT